MPTAQGLGDFFAGTFGHDPNRAGLNQYVATSQTLNGLRSAQTDEALFRAKQMQEEQEASGQLEDAFVGAGMQPSQAHLAATEAKRLHGSAKDALDAVKGVQSVNATNTLGDVNQLNSPAQTAAQQALSGKVATPEAIHPEYAVLPGMAKPDVQQTPLGAAQTGAQNAVAGLHNVQAAAGGFNPHGGGATDGLDPVQAAEVAEFIRQNPNLSSNFRSLLSKGGPDVIHAFLHPEGGAPSAPANGIAPAPGVSLKEQASIRNDFAGGTGAKQTTALNTMVLHSQLFDAVADQLGNGNFAPTNYINQLWQRTFGGPAPSNLKIAGSFLGREVVRATVNSGSGTGEERELAVGDNASPDQLHGAANTLRSLAAGQLHSLDLRAQRGGVDIAQLLGPEAQAAFGRRPVKDVQAPAEPAPAGGKTTPAAGGAQTPTGNTAPMTLDAYLKSKGF